MANRYWVGGNGTWNSTNTANWSTSSGGSGGASVPTSSDNVYFDDNSYATDLLAVTISGTVNCSSFENSRSGTKSLSVTSSFDSILNIYGTNAYTGASGRGNYTAMQGRVVSNNTTACTFSGYSVFPNINASVSAKLTINFTSSSGISNIFAQGNSSVTFISDTYVLGINGTNTVGQSKPQIQVGTNVFPAVLYLIGPFPCLNGNLTVVSSLPNKVVLTGTSGNTGIELYSDSSISYLEIDPAIADRTFSISGDVTIGTLARATSSLAFTLRFSTSTASSVKISTFSVEGDISTTINIQSMSSGVRGRVTKLGGGIVTTNYVQVKDMQPSPDNTWISYNSVNAGNNYQWYFDNFTKPTSSLFFGNHV